MQLRIGSRSVLEISSIQEKLKMLGYYTSNIDGIYGVGTARAVALFQYDNKLNVSGEVNEIVYNTIISKVVTKNDTLEKRFTRTDLNIEMMLDVMNDKKYVINEKENAINKVAIRMDENFDNQFSDILTVFWKNRGRWQFRTFDWTTMPGTLGQGGEQAPITTMGVTGVATLVEGQYINAYQFIDSYTGWLSYPYYQQILPVTIYRDGNRNGILERYSPVQRDLFGINIHRMSNNGQNSKFVNFAFATWSMGCQGNPEPDFAKLVELERYTASSYGNISTYTLLNALDFAKVF